MRDATVTKGRERKGKERAARLRNGEQREGEGGTCEEERWIMR